MNTTKITDTEIESLRVASLPTRPTAAAAFGGKGYTATEMKAAFDKLPMRIIDGFNSLIDEIHGGAVAEVLCRLEPFASLISDVKIIKSMLGM